MHYFIHHIWDTHYDVEYKWGSHPSNRIAFIISFFFFNVYFHEYRYLIASKGFFFYLNRRNYTSSSDYYLFFGVNKYKYYVYNTISSCVCVSKISLVFDTLFQWPISTLHTYRYHLLVSFIECFFFFFHDYVLYYYLKHFSE